MDRDALEYLMMIVENETPNFEFGNDFRGVMKSYGDVKMRIPPDARMSDNVIDRRGGRKPKEGPFVMGDNVERDETGEIVWKRERDLPPVPKMFEHDLLRTIFENVPQSYYSMQDDMREVRPQQEGPPMDREEMRRLIEAIMGPRQTPDAAQATPSLMRLLGVR